MTTSRCFLLCATLAASLVMDVSAQLLSPHWSIQGGVAVPQGEFAENIDRQGVGLSMFAGAQLRNTPVILGLEGSIYEYGREYFHVSIDPLVSDVTDRYETANSFISAHFVTRLQRPKGSVMPYAEGLLGLKYMVTETQLVTCDLCGASGTKTYRFENPLEEAVRLGVPGINQEDVSFSYGLGAGVMVLVAPAFGTNIHVNAGVRYLLGAPSEYLEEGAITRADGKVTYDVIRSRTDMLVSTLGVSFTLWQTH